MKEIKEYPNKLRYIDELEDSTYRYQLYGFNTIANSRSIQTNNNTNKHSKIYLE